MILIFTPIDFRWGFYCKRVDVIVWCYKPEIRHKGMRGVTPWEKVYKCCTRFIAPFVEGNVIEGKGNGRGA